MKWLIKSVIVTFLVSAVDCNLAAINKSDVAKYEKEMAKYYDYLPKSSKSAIENDPLRHWNHVMYFVNDMLGNYVLEPVIKVYTNVLPKPIRDCAGNWLDNLDESKYIIWNSMQFSPKSTTRSLSRFFINTIFGVGGLFDVAGAFGIKRKPTSFDEALGVWRVPCGPYIILPLLGPNTLRSTLTYAHSYGAFQVRLELIKFVAAVNNLMQNPYVASTKGVLKPLHTYMKLKPYLELFSRSLDPYAKVKTMWLQRREFTILQKQANLIQGKE